MFVWLLLMCRRRLSQTNLRVHSIIGAHLAAKCVLLHQRVTAFYARRRPFMYGKCMAYS